MSTLFVAVRDCDAVPGWQEQFLAHVLPAVESIGRIRFRNLPAAECEESLAEAVASAMINFVRLLHRGRNPILFAKRLARVAVLRVLAGRLSGSPDNSQDVLSRQARQQHGFGVESLSVPQATNSDWESVLVENHRVTPADIAASRLDFAAWLSRMKHRRREIAELLGAGYRTQEVAERFRLSQSRVSQMRREFESSWREFQREAHEGQTTAA
jgi:hypothetical protein